MSPRSTLVLMGLGLLLPACTPTGTPARLADLRDVKLELRADDAGMGMDVRVRFSLTEGSHADGDVCPTLPTDVQVAIDGRAAVVADAGGPEAEGLVTTTAYRCRPFRITGVVAPPLDRAVVFTLSDGTRTLRAEVERLFTMRLATLMSPKDGRAAFGAEVLLALPPGTVPGDTGASLYQTRPDGGWSAFLPTVFLPSTGLVSIRLPTRGSGGAQPGRHELEARAFELNVRTTCTDGVTCTVEPATTTPRFTLELE